ncbi:MAG TPA: hypothetical protein VNQ33_06820, partial [Acidimicrobiales bacterium]|nr:hypothetical protein [Acidimicrobiales bacterium]
MSVPARAGARAGFVVVAAASAAYAFDQVRHRAFAASTWDITLAWGVGVGCLVGLAAVGRGRAEEGGDRRGLIARGRHWRPTPYEAAGLSILAVASVARLAVLGRFPTVIDGDEGVFSSQAVLA